MNTPSVSLEETEPQPAPTVSRLTPKSMLEARERHRRITDAHAEDRLARSNKQVKADKLTALERIELLTDPGSFRELEAMTGPAGPGLYGAGKGDGVLTGHSKIHGQKVLVFAQDFTLRGGTFGEVHARKVARLLDLAESTRTPVVGLYDGGGARIDEGALALHGCGELFRRIVRLSGVVPQISVILGPCAGAAAYAPALTDFVFMVEGVGSMYLTGPDVVEAVTGESTTGQLLGGAGVHGRTSGVATFVHRDEVNCLEDVRYLLSLLPGSNDDPPARLHTGDEVDRSIRSVLDLVPSDPKTPYDMSRLVELLADEDTLIELHAHWGSSVICALARLDGRPVGVVANQPAVRAGVLDSESSEKAARFVQMCDAFSIPLITLVDVPGFMPGVSVESQGIIRHGAKLLHAYAAATVPRIQVIVRKAYGGAYIVMDSPSVGTDLSFAWPTNEVAVMGAEGAVEIIHRREISASENPNATRSYHRDAYRELHMHPYVAANSGLVHEVIDPTLTRQRLAEGLELLESKRITAPTRKHSNAP